MNKIKQNEMNNEENKKKEVTKSGKKKVSTLSPQDQGILSLIKAGRPMDRVCAQYMVHKEYVEALLQNNK